MRMLLLFRFVTRCRVNALPVYLVHMPQVLSDLYGGMATAAAAAGQGGGDGGSFGSGASGASDTAAEFVRPSYNLVVVAQSADALLGLLGQADVVASGAFDSLGYGDSVAELFSAVRHDVARRKLEASDEVASLVAQLQRLLHALIQVAAERKVRDCVMLKTPSV